MLKIILSILSAILLILSFPFFNLEYLAWVGFVPLLFALENVSAKRAFWLSYLCGAVFFLGAIYWLTYVTVAGYIILVLYLALYFGFFGIFYNKFTHHSSLITHNLFLIPSLWVSLEWLRSILLTGFGWALLGYSQCLNLPIIQIADITGVCGVSWLVMMVNVAIWQMISEVRGQRSENRKQKSEKQKSVLCPLSSVLCLLSSVLCLLVIIVYGFFRLNSQLTTDNSSLIVSVIQGNIPQEQKWDERYEKSIMQAYEDLTQQAEKDSPDLVIWPETALPRFLGEEGWLDTRITKFTRDNIKIPLLTGAPFVNDLEAYNSAALISEGGNIISRYDKLHLVPFGEYVPFGNLFPRIGRLGEIGDFSPGKEFTIFQVTRLPGYQVTSKFSVLICFEDIFPNLSRRFVKDGAQFLVNITNDAWFGKTSAPYQHAQASVFRAVENRVPVVRAANTGMSCFIDSRGRIYKTLKDREGNEIFIDGFATAEIHPSKRKSFYTTFGDVFAIICIIISIYGIIIKLWLR